MTRRKRRKPPEKVPGYSPPNAVAWCLLHDRGMNVYYIRKKHCLSRKVCKHLRWLGGERSK